jgi:hypothetical protein
MNYLSGILAISRLNKRLNWRVDFYNSLGLTTEFWQTLRGNDFSREPHTT